LNGEPEDLREAVGLVGVGLGVPTAGELDLDEVQRIDVRVADADRAGEPGDGFEQGLATGDAADGGDGGGVLGLETGSDPARGLGVGHELGVDAGDRGVGLGQRELDHRPRVAVGVSQAVGQHRSGGVSRRAEACERPGGESPHVRVVVAEARRHDFDPALVLAVMHVESLYDTYAVSHKDALGLMQILPSTGAWIAERRGIPWHGPQTLFDPITNVRIGVAYLRQLTDRYGSIRTALVAYNWGPGRIDRRLRSGIPLPREYAQLVLTAYGEGGRSS